MTPGIINYDLYAQPSFFLVAEILYFNNILKIVYIGNMNIALEFRSSRHHEK